MIRSQVLHLCHRTPLFQISKPIGNIAFSVRWKSVSKPEISPEMRKQVRKNVPGEATQTNNWQDRIPSFPFSKELSPTLLPRPGVPVPGPEMPLQKMIDILKSKQEPELIYEAEPHRLYFVFCGCFALVFALYSLNAYTIGFELSWANYNNNEMQLSENKRVLNLLLQAGITAVLGSMPLAAALLFILTPSRLIRRMWYLPGEVEHVKFITHPVIPGRPSPVITLPLDKIYRAQKAKVFTGRGFYGTLDTAFCFFLRERGRRFPWLMDRKGFFWGDGRVYDHIFGKEPIEEAAKGFSYNDRLRMRRELINAKEEEMKKKHGKTWRLKAQNQLMKQDVANIKKILAGGVEQGSPVKKLKNTQPPK